MIKHAPALILDWIADFVRPSDMMSRRHYEQVFSALGVTPQNLLITRDENLPRFRDLGDQYGRLRTYVDYNRYTHIPTQHQINRMSEIMSRDLPETRERVAACCFGEANVATWKGWLRSEDPEGLDYIPGAVGDSVARCAPDFTDGQPYATE